MERFIVSARESSLISSHQVLRNTYLLLAMTLAFSAVVAYGSMVLQLPPPNLWLSIFGLYGLLFLTHYLANSSSGILAVFAFTGFIGYTMAYPIGLLIHAGAKDVVITALGGTALVFFGCSVYLLTSRKEMSFLTGMLNAGAVVLLIAMVSSFFIKIPAFHLALSGAFILFSTGAILLKTSEIIHGGEKNYIRATVSIYVSLYNIFVSLLRILSANRQN